MKFLYFGLLLIFLSGCTALQDPSVHDPSQKLSRDDFKDLTQHQSFFEDEEDEVQDLLPVKPPRSGLTVSLTLQGKTPVSKIAKEISKQLKIGYLIQKDKEVDLSYSVENRALEDVLEDLETLTDLVFAVDGQLLSVKENAYTFQTYDLHYLALNREVSSNIAINTNSTGSKSGSNGLGNASQTEIKSSFKNNFWGELNQTIAQILGVRPKALEGSETKSEKKETDLLKSASYSLNRQSGHINIYGKQQQHRIISELLEKIKVILSSQILIEAKVVEIRLNDEFRSGINWSSIRKTLGITGNMGTIAKTSALPGLTSATDAYQFSLKNGKEFNSVLTFMETFGTVRTLSSPRLTVLNNQTAVLKVADNLTFFRVKTDVRTNYTNAVSNGYQENVVSESQIETVPVGFIMTVQPSIDPHTREIVLYLKPTITSVKQLRSDPAVDLTAKRYKLENVKSEIPVISVREIDSVLRMDSGSIAILGGLMQETSHNVSAGLPGFHDTPLTFLTHGKSDDHVVTELVIFIKASIARTRKKCAHDTHVYRKFFNDPRPLEPKKKESHDQK